MKTINKTIILTVSRQNNCGKIFIDKLGKVAKYKFEFNKEYTNVASDNIISVSLSEAYRGLP